MTCDGGKRTRERKCLPAGTTCKVDSSGISGLMEELCNNITCKSTFTFGETTAVYKQYGIEYILVCGGEKIFKKLHCNDLDVVCFKVIKNFQI